MVIRGLSCDYLFWSPELQQHHHALLLPLLLVPQLLPFLLSQRHLLRRFHQESVMIQRRQMAVTVITAIL
jgi:hypothetical protein